MSCPLKKFDKTKIVYLFIFMLNLQAAYYMLNETVYGFKAVINVFHYPKPISCNGLMHNSLLMVGSSLCFCSLFFFCVCLFFHIHTCCLYICYILRQYIQKTKQTNKKIFWKYNVPRQNFALSFDKHAHKHTHTYLQNTKKPKNNKKIKNEVTIVSI